MKIYLSLAATAGMLLLGGCKNSPFRFADRSRPATELAQKENKTQPVQQEPARKSDVRSAALETPPSKNETVQQSSFNQASLEEYLNLGHAEARLGHLDEAKHYYNLALRKSPSNATAHHRLAVIADNQNDFRSAEQHYESAYRISPKDPDLLADIGYSFFLQKQYRESEWYLNSALKIGPSHKRTLNNLALLYGTQGDYDRAFAILRRNGTDDEARQKMAQFFPREAARFQTAGSTPATPVSSISPRNDFNNIQPMTPPPSYPETFPSQQLSRLAAPSPRLAPNSQSQPQPQLQSQPQPQGSPVSNSRIQRFRNRQAGQTTPPNVPAITPWQQNQTAATGRTDVPPTTPGISYRNEFPEQTATPGYPQTNSQSYNANPDPRDQFSPVPTQPQAIQPRLTQSQATQYPSQPLGMESVPSHLPPQSLQAPPVSNNNQHLQLEQWPGNSYTPAPQSQQQNSFDSVPTNNNSLPTPAGYPTSHLRQEQQPGQQRQPNQDMTISPHNSSISPAAARQASIVGMNAGPGAMLPTINPQPSSPAIQQATFPNPQNGIATTPPRQQPGYPNAPTHWQGNPAPVRTASAGPTTNQYLNQPENRLTPAATNTAGSQSGAFRLIEQRKRQQIQARATQQLPQINPYPAQGTRSTSPQSFQQFPAAQYPPPQNGTQLSSPGMANGSTLR